VAEVVCYCGAVAILRDGKWGKWYSCPRYPDCDGAVGCHPGTTKPLAARGRLGRGGFVTMPRRARIAIAIQRAMNWLLDPWLRLIPDDRDLDYEEMLERAKEKLRAEGRREVLEAFDISLLDATAEVQGDSFDA